MTETLSFDIQKILEILPHRYPFLLVDRVEEMVSGDHIRAYKNLTYNEPFFQGHFPGLPVMPGVLIIEALAQTGVLLVAHSYPNMVDFQKNISLFAGIEKARFRSPVRPGDKLDMECSNLVHKLQFWKMDAKAYVGGVLVADARLTAAVFPREGM